MMACYWHHQFTTRHQITVVSCSKRVICWCQDRSMVRLMRIDPMVSGSSPTSSKLSLEEWGELQAHCNSKRRNHEVWSHREEGPGHCWMSKKLLSVHISTFLCLARIIYMCPQKGALHLVRSQGDASCDILNQSLRHWLWIINSIA